MPITPSFLTKTTFTGSETEILNCPDPNGLCDTNYEFKFCLDLVGGVPRHSLRVPEDEDVRERDKFIEIVYPKKAKIDGQDVYTKKVKVDLVLSKVVWWRAKRSDAYKPYAAEDFTLEVRGLAVDGDAKPDNGANIYTVELEVLEVQAGVQLGTPMCVVNFSVIAKANRDMDVGGKKIAKDVSFVVDPIVIIAPKRP